MVQLKLIVYATDFSAGAARAAELAAHLAKVNGARLHLLHVVTELGDRHRRSIPAGVMDTFVKEVNTQAMTDMHDFKQRLFGQFQGELTTEVVIGSGAETLLSRAGSLGADLIIMGSHGRHGLEKLLLGSTTERLIRQSSIPVLTVPEHG